MKKYYSVSAWYDDYDTMPEVYIVLAETREEAIEEVRKLYDEPMDIGVDKEIDLSLPIQKVFPW